MDRERQRRFRLFSLFFFLFFFSVSFSLLRLDVGPSCDVSEINASQNVCLVHNPNMQEEKANHCVSPCSHFLQHLGQSISVHRVPDDRPNEEGCELKAIIANAKASSFPSIAILRDFILLFTLLHSSQIRTGHVSLPSSSILAPNPFARVCKVGRFQEDD